jgi:hypothetical protein
MAVLHRAVCKKERKKKKANSEMIQSKWKSKYATGVNNKIIVT